MFGSVFVFPLVETTQTSFTCGKQRLRNDPRIYFHKLNLVQARRWRADSRLEQTLEERVKRNDEQRRFLLNPSAVKYLLTQAMTRENTEEEKAAATNRWFPFQLRREEKKRKNKKQRGNEGQRRFSEGNFDLCLEKSDNNGRKSSASTFVTVWNNHPSADGKKSLWNVNIVSCFPLLQGANASALEKEIGSEQFPVNEHYFGLVNVSDQYLSCAGSE